MHRMSLFEVGDVARRAAASGAKLRGGGPTVHKVADALGLSHAEVQTFLDQARDGSTKPIRDFKAVLALAAVVAAFLLGFGSSRLGNHNESSASIAADPASPGWEQKSYPVPSSTTRATGIVQPPTMAAVASRVDSTAFDPHAGSTTFDAKTSAGDVHRALDQARRGGGQVVRRADMDTTGLMAAAEFAETNVH